MPTRCQGTILLVDDDPAIRRLIHRLLEREGYRVLEAGSGRRALELFQAGGQSIDLLITDVRMPEMGGPALVDRLLPAAPRLPVLYITGYSDDDLVRPGLIFFELLAKPFSPEVLRAKVRQMTAIGARGAA